MIITLVKADFSKSNIGTLNSFSITTSLGKGCTYLGPRSVANGESLNASITVDEQYVLNNISISMGGIDISDYTINENTIAINIGSVTGRIVITVVTELLVDDGMIPVVLTKGNDYAKDFKDAAARGSIQPYAIVIPAGVVITPKANYKMAIYTNFKSEDMAKESTYASQTGGSAWDTASFTGKGEAIGIAIAKQDGDFNWDSGEPIYANDCLNSTDDSIWFVKTDEIPEGAGSYSGSTSGGNTPSAPDPTPDAGLGIDFDTATFDYGNAFGTAEQAVAKNRATSTDWIALNVGDVVGLKDNVNYKWALRGRNATSYWPDAAWTQKGPQTITAAGDYKFILLKADNSNFDFDTESNLVSEYYTLTRV